MPFPNAPTETNVFAICKPMLRSGFQYNEWKSMYFPCKHVQRQCPILCMKTYAFAM